MAPNRQAVEDTIVDLVSQQSEGYRKGAVTLDSTLGDLGFDSLDVVELSLLITEKWQDAPVGDDWSLESTVRQIVDETMKEIGSLS